MADIRTSELKEPIDVAEYLFRRLHQLGIRSIHGVPGDYNLVALDYIPENGLNWVGNVNELNAGYAADGYARVKGMAALITTFGVGELSALNAIAGAYSEYVPIVHIVGTPSTISQANGMLLHHTLGNGDFKVFANISRNISCATAALTDASEAAGQIDNTLRECYLQSRPAYIALPTDIVTKKVEGARLNIPIDLAYPPNEEEQEDYAVDVVMKNLMASNKPVILVDACSIRHRALEETHELVSISGIPTFVTPMGKGAIDETLPNYGGVYAGDGSSAEVREAVESSDLVLSIGAIKSDFNTAGFTYHTSQLKSIDFHSNLVRVRYSEYPGVRMNGVLRKVVSKIGKDGLLISARIPDPHHEAAKAKKAAVSNDTTITHKWFWPQLAEWVQPDDIIITETGTSGYGIWEVPFKPRTTAISQILWGSIGYAFGSLQGAALAASEMADKSSLRRTILFTGEGSFQLTAQELSTIVRHKLAPIIFLINNGGYTIERFIHGMEASYNDIGPWRYGELPSAFGAEKNSYRTYQVRTREEAEKLLKDKEFANADVLRFVEIFMPKDDAPEALKMTAEASAKNNAKQ